MRERLAALDLPFSVGGSEIAALCMGIVLACCFILAFRSRKVDPGRWERRRVGAERWRKTLEGYRTISVIYFVGSPAIFFVLVVDAVRGNPMATTVDALTPWFLALMGVYPVSKIASGRFLRGRQETESVGYEEDSAVADEEMSGLDRRDT